MPLQTNRERADGGCALWVIHGEPRPYRRAQPNIVVAARPVRDQYGPSTARHTPERLEVFVEQVLGWFGSDNVHPDTLCLLPAARRTRSTARIHSAAVMASAGEPPAVNDAH